MLLEESHSVNISPDVSVLAPAKEAAFYDKLISAKDANDAPAFESVLLMLKRAEELRIGIGKWRIQNARWDILFRDETELSPVILELASTLGFAIPVHSRF
jgi:hypothetical protein